MNIDELISVLAAIKAGEPIQYSPCGKRWSAAIGHGLQVAYMCSRIAEGWKFRPKPKPRELYVNEYPSGLSPLHVYTRGDADDDSSPTRIACHRFVQDLDYEG